MLEAAALGAATERIEWGQRMGRRGGIGPGWMRGKAREVRLLLKQLAEGRGCTYRRRGAEKNASIALMLEQAL